MTSRRSLGRIHPRWFLSILLLWCLWQRSAFGQDARIVYQGRLLDAGNPVTGSYAMRFTLFDTAELGTGNPIGDPIDLPLIEVKDGTFSAALDFGPGAFNGPGRFLEIGVRPVDSLDPLTLLNPRQEILPVPYAIRSLTESASGGGITADPQGNVAIGTNTIPAGLRLHVAGGMRISPGGSGGFLQVGTPNGETGLSLTGTNRVDLRFNGGTVTFAAGDNSGPPPPWNGITLNTNGNVGVGMTLLDPKSPWKLEVSGPTRFQPAGTAGGALQISTPNGETGLSILGQNRFDLRSDDSTVKLVAGPGKGTPGSQAGLAVNLAGNVGVGTLSPTTKLDVAGDITATRLILRADPVAPMNAAVLATDPGVTTFIPYNTTLGHALNLVAHDATVRTLTILGGADFAEPFPITGESIDQGSVVVIDAKAPGKLRRSTEAYDKRVAGVVSGANGVRPGITLRQEGLLDHGEMVALTGRVYVKASASNGPIEPGDLMTTSDLPGHAMKATDHQRRQGAILGKAMTGLEKGQGMVLVLVTLQ